MKNNWKYAMLSAATVAMVACGGGAEQEAVDASEAVEVQEVAGAATYTVAEGSTLNWRGFKTYSDGQHNGVINITQGSLSTDGGNLVGGSFTIDMNSIAPQDMEPSNEYYGKLVGHLKSGDFFAVDSFPTASFEITNVAALEGDESGATHNISGNLTIRGISKNITFPATVMMHEGMVHLKADTFVIDRTQWNVMFNSESWLDGITEATKDKLIDHQIEISFDLKANA